MRIEKIQTSRGIIQLIYLGLVIAGFFTALRPFSLILFYASFIFGNFFCGWICPFGSAQDCISRISSIVIKKKFKMPCRAQKYLQLSRYVLLALIIIIIGKSKMALPFDSYKTFIGILNGREIQILSIGFLAGFLIISIFFERPFCNYLCTEGIRFGLASFTRFFSIKRDQEKCVNCKKCDLACPMNIAVSKVSHLRNAQCINCFNCISACPVNKTLSFGFADVLKLIKDKLIKE